MNLKFLHNTRLIYIYVFSVFSSISIFETSLSFAMDRASETKSNMNFEEYFERVINYGVSKLGTLRFFKIEDKEKTFLENKKIISQHLIKITPSLSHFYNKFRNTQYTYLDLLFENNLGIIAEEISAKIKENHEKFPEKYEILLKIQKGESPEINSHVFAGEDLELAYKVANNSHNTRMVRKLYPLSHIEEKAETLKKADSEIYSSEMNYIHEPYWSYNLIQLQNYGHRIIDKIKPYFVDEESVLKNDRGTFILSNGEKIPVRTVEFGSILPNLYLKKRLADEKDETRRVSRIFIVPKGEDIRFRFRMPYASSGENMEDKSLMYGDSGINPLQVLSEDFVVYQEWIEGSGLRGSRKFQDLGHRDFNAVQIIHSSKDNKYYLIDTKEGKNFFVPFFSPFSDDYRFYKFPYKKYGIKDAKTYTEWQEKAQKVVYDAKALHFDPRIIFVDIKINLKNKVD